MMHHHHRMPFFISPWRFLLLSWCAFPSLACRRRRFLEQTTSDDSPSATTTSSSCQHWRLVQELHGEIIDYLGQSVVFANHGETLLVAGTGLSTVESRGFVRVYDRINDDPTFTERPASRLLTGDNRLQGIPRAVDLSASSGQTVVLGETAHVDAPRGRVRVYEYREDDWVQIGQDLVSPENNARFGHVVSLGDDGAVVAVGAPRFGEGSRGAVFVYARISSNNATEWAALGEVPLPPDSVDFGTAVALSTAARWLVIGDPLAASQNGRVHVYERRNETTTVWQLRYTLTGDRDFAQLGHRAVLAADGQTLAVTMLDSVRVYRYRNSSWEMLGSDLTGMGAAVPGSVIETAGIAVSLAEDGHSIAVGSPGGGTARVYRYQPSVEDWLLVGDETVGEKASDQYGVSVSLSVLGNNVYLAVGARFHDLRTSADNNGLVRIFTMNPSCVAERLDLERKEFSMDALAAHFVGVTMPLDQSATSTWETISAIWFDTFFEAHLPTIQDVSSRFSVRDQSLENANLTVEFSLRVAYVEATAESNFTSVDILSQPFLAPEYTAEYWDMLVNEIDTFADLQMPIEPPFVVQPLPGGSALMAQQQGRNTTILVASIVPAALVVALLLVVVLFRRFKQDLPVGEVVEDADIAINADGAILAELVDENRVNDVDAEMLGAPSTGRHDDPPGVGK